MHVKNILCWPVRVPQTVGGEAPVGDVATAVSPADEQTPVSELGWVNTKLSKSSLMLQRSSQILLKVQVQVCKVVLPVG